jgi:uncharacterized protein YegP (UPF0339 family)
VSTAIEFHLERSQSTEQPYLFQVYESAAGKRRIAYSETYTAKAGVNNAVHAIRSGNAVYDPPFKGDDGKWYFHVQGDNNRILCRGAWKYGTEAEAKADSDRIRTNASGADYIDYAG